MARTWARLCTSPWAPPGCSDMPPRREVDRRHRSAPSPEQLARMLGGWMEDPGILPERLARALRQLVELGELVSGTRLPSERALATALVISRSTVVSGYHIMHGEGLLETKPGSGHWIASGEAARNTELVTQVPFPWTHRLALPESAVGYPPSVVDLSAIAISASPVLLEVLATLTVEDWASATLEPGYLPLGWPPLRRAVAEQCSRRGLPTSPQQVMITSGAQQGMSLVAGAFVQPGDVVVVEDPLYPGQLPVLRAAGARLGRCRWTTAVSTRKRSPRLWHGRSRVLFSSHRPITTLPGLSWAPKVVRASPPSPAPRLR